MREIKFYGRGGQGAVTAAQILASAAFIEGKYAQTFPQFGAERRGAPVLAYVRIDHEPINIRSKVYQPDVVVVMDLNLLKMANPFTGIKPKGVVILNGSALPSNFSSFLDDRSVQLHLIDASSLAQQIYRNTPIPIVNVIIIGSYCRALGDVGRESITHVRPDYFPQDKVDLNRKAARMGYENLKGVSWPT